MKFKYVVHQFSIVVFFTLFMACNISTKDKQKTTTEGKSDDDTLKYQIEAVVYNIPSPSEIPYLLKTTGAEFNESLLNPLEKVNRYTAKHEKTALNLGVYAADIGYLSAYEKTQLSIDYLGAVKTLSDNLGVLGAFDNSIIKRFEANIGNGDSLARVLDETILSTNSFLKDHNRNNLSALIVAGSFIEGLYISTGIVKSYPKNILPEDKRNLILTPIMRVVLEQKKSISELLKMMKSVEQTDLATLMVTQLTALEVTYNHLHIEEQIKNNHAHLILNDKNLETITVLVTRLRSSIVE